MGFHDSDNEVSLSWNTKFSIYFLATLDHLGSGLSIRNKALIENSFDINCYSQNLGGQVDL